MALLRRRRRGTLLARGGLSGILVCINRRWEALAGWFMVEGGGRVGGYKKEMPLENYWRPARRRQMRGRGAVQECTDEGCQA